MLHIQFNCLPSILVKISSIELIPCEYGASLQTTIGNLGNMGPLKRHMSSPTYHGEGFAKLITRPAAGVVPSSVPVQEKLNDTFAFNLFCSN